MVNNKRKLSLEEQEFLRAEWRKQHPEEAARRDAKRKLAKEEKAKLLREKEDFEQENLVLSETPNAFWKTLFFPRSKSVIFVIS